MKAALLKFGVLAALVGTLLWIYGSVPLGRDPVQDFKSALPGTGAVSRTLDDWQGQLRQMRKLLPVLRSGDPEALQELASGLAAGEGLILGEPPMPGGSPKETISIASAAPSAPSTLYRWRDEQGLLHLSDSPPPEGVAYELLDALTLESAVE